MLSVTEQMPDGRTRTLMARAVPADGGRVRFAVGQVTARPTAPVPSPRPPLDDDLCALAHAVGVVPVTHSGLDERRTDAERATVLRVMELPRDAVADLGEGLAAGDPLVQLAASVPSVFVDRWAARRVLCGAGSA